jgi:hypothetical protein
MKHARDRVRRRGAHELDALNAREFLVRLGVPAHGAHHELQAVRVGARQVGRRTNLVQHGTQPPPEQGNGREMLACDDESMIFVARA